MKQSNKVITITGRRWHDDKNGNTYCSSEIFIDGRRVHTIGMTYGYEEQYLTLSMDWLYCQGFIASPRMYDNNVVYTVSDVVEKTGLFQKRSK